MKTHTPKVQTNGRLLPVWAKRLALAALMSATLAPLSGCLTPDNPYKLSTREVQATLAGQKLAGEALRRNRQQNRLGGESGGGGGGGGD